jgi:hypothetical protein
MRSWKQLCAGASLGEAPSEYSGLGTRPLARHLVHRPG